MAEKKGVRRILPPILGGEGPLGLKIPKPWEGSPVDLIKAIADGVQILDKNIIGIDEAITKTDEAIANTDRILSNAGKRTTRTSTTTASEPVFTPEQEQWQKSFPEQTSLDYCIECLRSKHFPKAKGLLEEAMSFSRKEGKLSKEGAIRVREAIQELVTADKDIETADFEAGREIQNEMRRIRKQAWSKGMYDPGGNLQDLTEAIRAMDNLLAMTEKAATTPGMKCPDCERAVEATCQGMDSPFREKCTEFCRRMIDYKLPPEQNAAAFDKLESLIPGTGKQFYRNLYGRETNIR